MGVLLKLLNANLKQLKEYKNSFNDWKWRPTNKIGLKLGSYCKFKIQDPEFLVNSNDNFYYYRVQVFYDNIYVNIVNKTNIGIYYETKKSIWLIVPINKIIYFIDNLEAENINEKEEFKIFIEKYIELLKDCIVSEVMILTKSLYKKRLTFDPAEDLIKDDYSYLIELVINEETYEPLFCTRKLYKNESHVLRLENLSLTLINSIITNLKLKILKKFPGSL